MTIKVTKLFLLYFSNMFSPLERGLIILDIIAERKKMHFPTDVLDIISDNKR